MVNINNWLNGILIDLGLPAGIADLLDKLIIITGILFFAYIVDYIYKKFVIVTISRLAKHTSYKWDNILLQRKAVNYLIHMIPAILIYTLLPAVFEEGNRFMALLQKACNVYIILPF